MAAAGLSVTSKWNGSAVSAPEATTSSDSLSLINASTGASSVSCSSWASARSNRADFPEASLALPAFGVGQHRKGGAGLRASVSDQPLHQRQRVAGTARRLIECRQLVRRRRGIRMVGTDRALTDRQRPLEQRAGLGVTALPFIEIGE